MKLVPDGELVTLEELPAGTLFSFSGDIVLKSEYTTEKGLIEAFILGSGELFCGGCPIEEQPQLKVQPLKLISFAEEVKPIIAPEDDQEPYRYPSCDADLGFSDDYFGDVTDIKENGRYCQKCGQKMC